EMKSSAYQLSSSSAVEQDTNQRASRSPRTGLHAFPGIVAPEAEGSCSSHRQKGTECPARRALRTVTPRARGGCAGTARAWNKARQYPRKYRKGTSKGIARAD